MKKCDYCAEEIQDDAKKCKYCGEWINKSNHQLGHCKQKVDQNKSKQKLEGFSGWLALFGLGVFITPIIILFQVVLEPQDYDGLGVFFNVLIILLYIWLNYLMIKRRRIFKKWFLWVGVFQIILVGLIALGVNSESSLYSQSELSDINSSFVRTVFYVAIWSLYLWNSERARNTFIN